MPDNTPPRIHSPEYYEKLAALEDSHPWTEAMRKMGFALMERFSSRVSGAKWLDAGCGTGLFLRETEDRSSIAVAAGCDTSLNALRRARNREVSCLMAATLNDLPFQSECLDGITCFDVIQHLSSEDAHGAVEESRRVLKSGGVLIIRAAARRGWRRMRHRDSRDYQQWEPEKLRGLIEGCGFRIVFVALVNSLPSIWADLRGGVSGRVPRGDQGLGVRWLSKKSLRGRVLSTCWSLERRWILDYGGRPRRGHTVFCVGTKA